MSNAPRLTVGYVAGAHGIGGVVRVQLHDPDSKAVRPGVELVLAQGRDVVRHRVESVDRVPGKRGLLRVRLEAIDAREQAEALARASVEIDREALPPLEEGEFYLADAIGLAVVRVAADGTVQALGSVVAVSSNGAQDLFEVQWRDEGGQAHDWLLPVLPQFVREVGDERIVVDVPEGFLPEALEA
jgi:16S rRNA processing protein RimM